MSVYPSPGSSGRSEPMLPPPLDLSHHFSVVTRNRLPSKIKQYYKFFQIPGIGNIAGGLPNARFFPFDTLEAQVAKERRWTPTPGQPGEDSNSLNPDGGASRGDEDVLPAAHIVVPKTSAQQDILKKIDLSTALQYGTAEGFPPLRSFIRQFTRECLHPNVPYKGGPEVILSCGNTDGFSKTLELLTDVWDPDVNRPEDREGLLVEAFLYTNVLNQAKPRGVQIVPVEIDQEGMMPYGPGGLEEVLATWDEKNGKRPHLMYTVTMGHNPTSGILSVERRKQIYALCSKYDVIIVEDDPYWYLQYPSAEVEEAKSRGQPIPQSRPAYEAPRSSGYPFLDSLVPSYLSVDTDGRVIRLDTFSKTIAPGCRMGWITAQPEFIERFMRIAETSTQQPSGFVQSMVAELIMGSQPEASSKFQSLSAKEKLSFSGWQTDGWVRWLAGLRGEYERRMNRMCTILDEGSFQLKQSTSLRASDADWGIITKTRLISFEWPRGGMFVWLRVHFETHPLWQAPGTTLPVIDGPVLSTALMIFLTKKPALVLAMPGLMFSANDEIRIARGWAFYRLCFAAETEKNVDACSARFTDGVQRFWRIKSVADIEALVGEAVVTQQSEEGGRHLDDGEGLALGNLGAFMGC